MRLPEHLSISVRPPPVPGVNPTFVGSDMGLLSDAELSQGLLSLETSYLDLSKQIEEKVKEMEAIRVSMSLLIDRKDGVARAAFALSRIRAKRDGLYDHRGQPT